MRANVRAFVALAAEVFALRGPVYEFGSYLVAGQEEDADLRSLFPGREYVGCDVRPGPGVDRIEDLAGLSLPSGSVPTAVCVDTLEHVFKIEQAVNELCRVLAPGGTLVVAVPFDFHVHHHPDDYWRLTPSCLARLLEPLEASLVAWQGGDRRPHTVLGMGFKQPIAADLASRLQQFVTAFQDWLRRAAETQPWKVKARRWLLGWLRSKGDRRRWREQYSASFVLRLPVGGAAGAGLLAPPRPRSEGSRLS